MLTRSEEATCFHQHFFATFTAPLAALVQANASGNLKVDGEQGAPATPFLDPQALAIHLKHAPLRKAVPPGHPPSAVYGGCARTR